MDLTVKNTITQNDSTINLASHMDLQDKAC